MKLFTIVITAGNNILPPPPTWIWQVFFFFFKKSFVVYLQRAKYSKPTPLSYTSENRQKESSWVSSEPGVPLEHHPRAAQRTSNPGPPCLHWATASPACRAAGCVHTQTPSPLSVSLCPLLPEAADGPLGFQPLFPSDLSAADSSPTCWPGGTFFPSSLSRHMP